MVPLLNINNKSDVVKIAVIVAIILGFALSVFFMVIQKESFSAIYLIPNSVIHTSNDNTVFYKYGVKSSESGKMDYTLETYVNTIPIKTRQFSLSEGEILEEQEKIVLPHDIQFPSKISLRLTTVTGIEEVHFWIKQEQEQ